MTQRIFDVENETDMQDLWSILPDKVHLMVRGICDDDIRFWYDTKGGKTSADCYLCDFLKINWHDKTEITRPVDYESMIGCIGWFWGSSKGCKVIGILTAYEKERTIDPFCRNEAAHYANFCPAKKSELKFWEED